MQIKPFIFGNASIGLTEKLAKLNYALTEFSNLDLLEQLSIENYKALIFIKAEDILNTDTNSEHLKQVCNKHFLVAIGAAELALATLRAGATDYLKSDFDQIDLEILLLKIERTSGAEIKIDLDKQQRFAFSSIIAKSQQMLDILDTVKRLSRYNTTVLITGESGTGKELIAQSIHNNSPRKGKAFVAINCGAIPETLIESELFGHKKGAFTDASRDKKGLFEEADGGTIFLDEIGELPLQLQVKLLRTLQEQQIRRVGDENTIPIDVRVIAATLRDLESDLELGRFREDLFYRLNVVGIHIPALRERKDDIQILINNFIKKFNKRHKLEIDGFSEQANKLMLNYSWPGNVRELENCVERSMVLSDTKIVDLDSLPATILASAKTSAGSSFQGINDDNLSIKKMSRDLERDLILRALKKTKNNRTHAAKLLEISHRALLYKLKEYDIASS